MKTCNIISDKVITSGVPHGSYMGPLLFICYVNNLDDIRLYCCSIPSVHGCTYLLQDTARLHAYFLNNSSFLTFNKHVAYIIRNVNKSIGYGWFATILLVPFLTHVRFALQQIKM